MIDLRRFKEHCRLSTTAVVFVAMLLPPCEEAELDLNCLYGYTEQLQLDPTCNPYPGRVMWLECSVKIPLNVSDISIGWFLNCMELTNDSHVTILTQDMYTATEHFIRSRLTITDITDDYAGYYTCNILGDEEYIPSDHFRLHDSTYLEVDLALGECVEGDVFGTAEIDEKCADVRDDNPMSPICTEPVAPSSHDISVTTSSIIAKSPSLLTSIPVVQSTSTSSPSISLPSIHNTLSTTTLPPTNTPMITGSPQSSSEDFTSKYLIIACAVSVIVTVVFWPS